MKKSKKTLLICGVSLLAVFVLLVGVTFAWFAVTINNSGNRIQAGTLKIDFLMDKAENGEYTSIADGEGDIFVEESDAAVNWEPNRTEIVWLAVENDGSLAVDFSVTLNVAEEEESLVGSLQYAVLDGAKATDGDLPADWDEIPDGDKHTLAAGDDNIVLSDVRLLAAESDEEKSLHYFAIAVHMDENAGIEYMGRSVVIDATVLAEQTNVE